MDSLITRIVEIEQNSTLDIERAESASRKKIEEHRLALAEEKERTHLIITSTENSRLTKALQDLKKQNEEALFKAVSDYETSLQDPVKVEAAKRKIIAIILAG